jgi:hypothetical protein
VRCLYQWYPRLLSLHKFSAYSLAMLLEGQHEDSSTLPKSVDKSEALFTLYLDRSDEDDRKTTERWKGECDAILIFVSRSYLTFESHFCANPMYRLVFSRRLLRLFLPFPFQAFSQTHRTPQRFISETSIMYSPIPLPPSLSSSPSHLIYLNFVPRNP